MSQICSFSYKDESDFSFFTEEKKYDHQSCQFRNDSYIPTSVMLDDLKEFNQMEKED